MTKKFELKKPTNQSADGEAHHPAADVEEEEEATSRARGTRPKFSRVIPVDRIHPNPWQARQVFDETKLAELSESMQEHGWVGGGLPVRAHPTSPNEYQLVFGERRWRAAKRASLAAIPCEVSTFTDDDMVEIGLIENIQREDLSRYEEGVAYQRLLELRDDEGRPRYSQRSLAKRLGKDKSYVEDRLQYARAPEAVQQLVQERPDIAPRMVRELAHVENETVLGALIEAVRQDQVDIEDVRQIRKQLGSQANSGTEVAEIEAPAAVTSIVVPETEASLAPGVVEAPAPAVDPPVLSENTERWMLRGRLEKDHARIKKLLSGWLEVPVVTDDSIRATMSLNFYEWEELITQLKKVWRKTEA
jgi:ParB family transcriptional regulator, chromosome partitioning protein